MLQIAGTSQEGRSDGIEQSTSPPLLPCAFVVVNDKHIMRESLQRALAGTERVAAYPTVETWLASGEVLSENPVLLLCIAARRASDSTVAAETSLAIQAECAPAVVLVGDLDGPDQVRAAIATGAKGYVPSCTPLDVAKEAINLVRAGGIFVPASCLATALQGDHGITSASAPDVPPLFTSKQAAVVRALRQGKANKIIAYELGMMESTVKVHVRNVMRKLGAHNRTEVAFRTNGMFGDEM